MVIQPDAERSRLPSQSDVYRKYLELQTIAVDRFHGPLAGHLIVSAGFGMEGTELALAATLAGGVFLGVEPNPQRLKAAIRNGSCDFMVNTLDEALRVLKNELRKQKPLSVGLLGDASEILPAMVERGVQPDLIADTSPLGDTTRYAVSSPQPGPAHIEAAMEAHRLALRKFVERGAGIVPGGAGMRYALSNELFRDSRPTDALAHAVTIEVVWTADNLQDLQQLDRIALELLPAEDFVRRDWLEGAPGCFYRQLPLQRVLGVLPDELPQLLDAFTRAKSLQSPASVCWMAQDETQQTLRL